jgi:hypothetical protein
MDTNQLDAGKTEKARKKLADDLAGIDSEISFMSMKANEMVSLIVDETIKGVDIKIRYPDFYQKLLSNTELRQVFLDTLESIEAEKQGEMVALPSGDKPNLAFLTRKSQQPGIHKLDRDRWQIILQKTIQQLQDIFSGGPALAYRSDANLFDDSWFTLARGEVELEGTSYSILLECGISKETEEALSAFLNIAMTLETANASLPTPIHVTLQWGKYSETLTIAKEGRTRFPDIPFSDSFDAQDQKIIAGLDLILEIKPR